MQVNGKLVQAIFEKAGIGEAVRTVEFVAMPDYAVNVVCFVNSRFVVRCSDGDAEARFTRDRELLDSLAEFSFVPGILVDGSIPGTGDGFFQIQTRVAGHNMSSIWAEASESLRRTWITDLATAMHQVHEKRVSAYRIGCYQSAIRNWPGSWISGHDRYMEVLLAAAYSRSPADWEHELMQRAERFYADHRETLTYESGARVGHGDLHLLNVLGTDAGMSGIIDWEWSYGGGVEPEYDLEALVRWALYPQDIGDDTIESPLIAEMFNDLIPTFLEAYPGLKDVPELATRMTIYQIEHELHHIVMWEPSIPRRPLERLRLWVDERVLSALL